MEKSTAIWTLRPFICLGCFSVFLRCVSCGPFPKFTFTSSQFLITLKIVLCVYLLVVDFLHHHHVYYLFIFSFFLFLLLQWQQRISERAFDGLNNLRILNLQNNKIALLENGVFSTVPAVTTLNLNNNLLEWLTYTTVLPIMDNLVNNTSSVLSISGKFFFRSIHAQ